MTTAKKVSLFEKSIVDQTPMEESFVDAWRALEALVVTATEARDRIQKACDTGDLFGVPFPSRSLGNDWRLVTQALKAERELTVLFERIRRATR